MIDSDLVAKKLARHLDDLLAFTAAVRGGESGSTD